VNPPRLIADVNVFLFGLVAKQGSLTERFYRAFSRSDICLVFSSELTLELQEIVAYPKVVAKGVTPAIAFRLAREIYELGEYYPRVNRYDWPSLKDKKDWYLLNLLFDSGADGLITQDQSVLDAGKFLGMPVFSLSEGAAEGWY
jgi:putative PIN family toxin of toxin-antitoxin system